MDESAFRELDGDSDGSDEEGWSPWADPFSITHRHSWSRRIRQCAGFYLLCFRLPLQVTVVIWGSILSEIQLLLLDRGTPRAWECDGVAGRRTLTHSPTQRTNAWVKGEGTVWFVMSNSSVQHFSTGILEKERFLRSMPSLAKSARARFGRWTRVVPARHAVEAHCCSRVVLSKAPSIVPRVGQMSLAHAQGTTRLPGTCSRQAG